MDHQGGLVTGFAFDKGIEFLFSATETGKVEMCSLSFEGLMTFNVQRPVDEKQYNWGDYLRGAVWAMQADHRLMKGIKGLVQGSMPVGGVSSSAALLCGFVKAIAKVNGIELTPMEVIKYASKAEREYVGLRNGILDQACVVLCEDNKLLYLDTDTSEYELLPFGGTEGSSLPFEIGVFFSGVTRKLTGTDYNLRVTECQTAAWMIEAYEDIPLRELEKTRLRDVGESLFAKHETKMPQRFARRAKHFYSECNRVKEGIRAWKEGDIKKFGQLVFESCESSINNYECGSKELISIYEIMKDIDGVYGGRFSGAGFKGACIAIVAPEKKEHIREQLTTRYLERFPEYADTFEVYFCKPCDGVDFL